MLAGLAAAVQGTVALGRHRGARIGRWGDPSEERESPATSRCHARSNGYDLHAGLVVPDGQRERLERGVPVRPAAARWRLIALIEEAAVIGRILRHLGVPTEIPAPRPARAPPLCVGAPDHAGWDDNTSVFTPCS